MKKEEAQFLNKLFTDKITLRVGGVHSPDTFYAEQVIELSTRTLLDVLKRVEIE